MLPSTRLAALLAVPIVMDAHVHLSAMLNARVRVVHEGYGDVEALKPICHRTAAIVKSSKGSSPPHPFLPVARPMTARLRWTEPDHIRKWLSEQIGWQK